MAIYSEVMAMALTEMPTTFSSTDFSRACQQLGLPKSAVHGGGLARFLKNAKIFQITKKTWSKSAPLFTYK